MAFKIGDKVVILSINEKEGEEHFKYYSVVDGIQVKEDGDDIYTIGGKRLNPEITVLATKDEVKEFYN